MPELLAFRFLSSLRGSAPLANHAPALLSQKAAKPGHYVGAPTSVSLAHKLSESITRPFILILTQPIVQVVSLYLAYVYGLLPRPRHLHEALANRPREFVSISGLSYLALDLGVLVGSIGGCPTR
ncbi:hypothetical protein DFJ73DRAFT_936977 [Zopfochytrium polystomum]|nr:hypothetical protein DFJ73DRAFT_936977 [Zopfochytrium polystomum]